MRGDQMWRKMDSAPKDKLVEVCGDSGMTTNRWFLTLAIWDEDAFPGCQWRDVKRDALSDCGWVPLYWRPASTFPKSDPLG